MPVNRKEFAAAVQHDLPQAKVFWKVEPDYTHTDKPCALTATDNSNPAKTFTMEMTKGLGHEPLDDLVADFVEFFKNS